MKIKYRHYSKSMLSVILALCMLISCMTVALVPTDAARVNSDSVGYTEYNLSSGQVFYFDNSSTGWSSVKLMVMKKNGGSWSGGPWDLTQVSGSNYWTFTASSAWNGYTHYLFYSGTWSDATQTDDIEGELATSSWYTDCFTPTASTGKWGGSFSNCVGAKNFSVTASNTQSGSGTSSSPYIVQAGSSVTLTASATAVNSNCTVNYKFDNGSYSSSTNTKTFTASSTGDYSFSKTVSVKTTRGDYNSSETTKTVYFKTAPLESTYSVSVSAGTGGSLSSSSSVTAGSTIKGYLPTANADYGYKFVNWTTSSTGVTIHNATSNDGTAYVNATAAGSVKANFEVDMTKNIYIVGRFRYRATAGANWTTTYSGTGDWDNESTKIKLSATSTDFVYKLETNASLAELSEKIGGGSTKYEPYFHLKDGNNVFAPASNTDMSETGTILTTTGAENMLFNSSSSDTPVTIYFNTSSKKIWYEIPTYYTVSCNTADGGSVSSDLKRAKENETVTLTITPETGYQLSSITVKDAGNNTVTLNGSGNSRTFSMPASNVTVTPTFSKIGYTLTKANTTNGSFTLSPSSTAYYQDTVTVSCTPSANYEVDTVKFNGQNASGSGNSRTFSMPAANTTVTVTFKEKLHTITVDTSNSNHGYVLRGSTIVSGTTTQIGYVNAVTLVATNQTGYTFDHWTITKGTASSAKINGNVISLSTNTEQTISGSASSTFMFNGTATVKAYFTAVDYSLSAKFSHNDMPAWNNNTVSATDTNGNDKSSVNINDLFEIRVTLADKYAINGEPSFKTGSGFGTATLQSDFPTTSGNVVIYRYKLTSVGAVEATVTLKAATPTIKNVQIKNTSFIFATPGNPTQNYYLQPTEVKAETQSFSRLSYNNTRELKSEQTSGTAVSLAQPTVTLNTENATADYTLTITATNSPDGVVDATVTKKYTIRVSYNAAQKKYFKFTKLLDRCVREDTSNNPYFKIDAPISAYNTAYDAAKTYIGGDYPAYNAGSDVMSDVQSAYDSFKNALDNMMIKANTTTVYLLSKYANSTSAPINMYMSSNGTANDFKHFLMYAYGKEINEDNEQNYHMTYHGNVTRSNTTYYLYTYTYAGHANFAVWKGTSASDISNSGKQLTGTVTNATEFKDYYVNVYNTDVNSTSVTSCTEYTDFGIEKSTSKIYIEKNETKTGAQIKGSSMFNFTNKGSIVGNPGSITTSVQEFTITGPIGKAGVTPSTVDLTDENFTGTVQGKYTVSYTVRFGNLADGGYIDRNIKATLWVAYDDVSIYVDMNDNVGTPILNFKYYVNSSGTAVNQDSEDATEAYLPYEMDLVTGSESIYRYTIKISKLRESYNIQFAQGTPINISYITVENKKIGQGTGFNIGIDARITGEVWLKADSSKLKTFNVISYGSVTNQFLAVYQNGSTNTLLTSPLKSISGTGIHTDEDEIYKVQYAANDGESVFHYTLSTKAKQEIKSGNNTYYFDKWIRFSTPEDGLNPTTSGNNTTTVTLPSTTEDYNTLSTDLNFTSAPNYNDGNGEYTYVALYKLAQTGDSTVRVEITYNFKDFNTSDGNYVYDANKMTVAASYTKTVKIPVGSGQTYANFAAVQAAVNAIAGSSVPYIQSNYFTYLYTADSAVVDSTNTSEAQSKIVVTAGLTETARKYTIIVKNGGSVVETEEGKYLQTIDLSAGNLSNPAWKDSAGNLLATGDTYKARFVSSGNENNDGTDCQIINLTSDSNASAKNKSVVSNAFTEVAYVNETTTLKHNFYIIDYCAEGDFVGGGVLYATTKNGAYRQSNAATQLASVSSRESFISEVLNNDFETEYKAQTINNIGFRYLPYKSTDDTYRFSSVLTAYTTMFEGTNVNSTNYDGQKLRVFSFMVYNDGGTKVIVPSEGYAEVSRYVNQAG